MSDEEWSAIWAAWNNEFTVKNTAQSEAIKALGYICLYGNDKQRGPYLAPNGVTYNTSDEFYIGYGCVPCYKKDGVWYGWWEIVQKHNLDYEMTSVCPVNLAEWDNE
jgi:hypothetical protein